MKKNWERFEEWLAVRWCSFNGRTSPASGARWHTKQDVRGTKMYPIYHDAEAPEEVLVQAKSGEKSATVTAKDLQQLVVDAVKEGRVPYVAVAVGDLAFVGEVVSWRG